MSLLSHLTKLVRVDLLSNGYSIMSNGKVLITKSYKSSVRFSIEGVGKQEGSIFWHRHPSYSEGIVQIYCSCRDSSKLGEFCEHGMAALLHLSLRHHDFQSFERSCKNFHFAETGSNDSIDLSEPINSWVWPYNQGQSSNLKRSDQKLSRIWELIKATEPSKYLTDASSLIAKPVEYSPLEIWYQLSDHGIRYDGSIEIKLKQRSILTTTGKISSRKGFSCPINPEDFCKLQFVHHDDRKILKQYANAQSIAANITRFSRQYEKDDFKTISLKDPWTFDDLEEIAKTGRLYFDVESIPHPNSTNERNDRTIIVKSRPDNLFRWWFIAAPSEEAPGHYKLSLAARSAEGEQYDIKDVMWTDFSGALITLKGELRRTPSLAKKLVVLARSIMLEGCLTASKSDLEPLIQRIISIPGGHSLDAPDEINPNCKCPAFTPRLGILRTPVEFAPDHVYLNIAMIYGSHHFELHNDMIAWSEMAKGQRINQTRNLIEEQRQISELLEKNQTLQMELGQSGRLAYHATVAREDLIDLVCSAVSSGWRVDYEGKSVKVASHINMGISSGINWFNVSCEATFDGQIVRGLELLRAKSSHGNFVTLADGSLGLLRDESFVKNLNVLRRLSKTKDDETIKISKLEGLLFELEGLAAEKCDRDAAAFFERVQSFKTISPLGPPKGFVGDLRPYQREGISWLNYLMQTGFGGILADDMGLGKTVQVIAHLVKVYSEMKKSKEHRPSLVIAPKSVLYNWKKEIQRFAPKLNVDVLESSGKSGALDQIGNVDILVASYHLARNQIKSLTDQEFEYIIIDEAHAIKNRSTQVTRSVKLLQARHRLALTGTPIENSLENLASIFEFLNPDFGSTNLFSKAGTGLDSSPAELKEIAAALRPFMLRRTKQQVLTDLPPKTESVIYCELSDNERREYDSLALAIKKNLNKEIEKNGIGKSQIHILAALTRLRQAACNLSLVDKSFKEKDQVSTKFAVIIDRIKELANEGEKCLVFSQFTEHLKLAKKVLEANGIFYCYLDGQTQDREKVIQEFNSRAHITVFLLSLKAGGVGLNLTSATNCFILDPWWNPAAESQAIDRAYRIGQTKPVFAYRIISRNTVEEKILQLQGMKTDLSNTILDGNEGAPRPLTRDDLNALI